MWRILDVVESVKVLAHILKADVFANYSEIMFTIIFIFPKINKRGRARGRVGGGLENLSKKLISGGGRLFGTRE